MPFIKTNEKLSKTEKEKQFMNRYKKMVAGLQRRGAVTTKKKAMELFNEVDDSDVLYR